MVAAAHSRFRMRSGCAELYRGGSAGEDCVGKRNRRAGHKRQTLFVFLNVCAKPSRGGASQYDMVPLVVYACTGCWKERTTLPVATARYACSVDDGTRRLRRLLGCDLHCAQEN